MPNSGGSASINFYDGGATPGFTIEIEGIIANGEGTGSITLTPR